MAFLADIKHLLHTIILFQCFLLAFYLIGQTAPRRSNNRILAAFLIAKGLSEFSGVFRFFREIRTFIFETVPYLFYVPVAFYFLYVPLLFLYVLSMTQARFEWKKRYLLHAVPFLFAGLYILAAYGFRGSDGLREQILTGHIFTRGESRVFNWSSDIQFFLYAVLSLRLLAGYRRRVKETYSTIQQIDLSWLRFVIFGFIAWRSIGILQTVLYYFIQNECLILLYITSLLVFLIFVSVIVFRGLRQPQIFIGHGVSKNHRFVLPDGLLKTYVKKLNRFMETEKPYVNSELTLDMLSEVTEIPPRHLSKVLNEGLKQNFFDYINRYRVEEAKTLLKSSMCQHYTILAVAFEAGFNSKSTFNLIFKKYTQKTPSQYRKLILET